jgi:hypothetical protein
MIVKLNGLIKTMFCAVAIAAALLAGIGLQAPSEAAEPQFNILIISWDGVQRNHLNELLQAGKLPTWRRCGTKENTFRWM